MSRANVGVWPGASAVQSSSILFLLFVVPHARAIIDGDRAAKFDSI
jgi:hypothetical protein